MSTLYTLLFMFLLGRRRLRQPLTPNKDLEIL